MILSYKPKNIKEGLNSYNPSGVWINPKNFSIALKLDFYKALTSIEYLDNKK